jgi:hypothetical protein
MTTSFTREGSSDIPTQVFKKFLEALVSSGASTELVARLGKTLLEDRTFTEIALKEAVLGEESVP